MDDGKMDGALIERIRARLRDDWRRTGDGDYTRMPKELRRKVSGSDGGGLASLLFQAVLSREPMATEGLKPIEPLREAQVAKVERALGFSLPTRRSHSLTASDRRGVRFRAAD